MTKEDYLRKKGRLPRQNYGIMFTFNSSRENGPGEITEVLIWDIHTMTEGIRWTSKTGERMAEDVTHYTFKDDPYSGSIRASQKVGETVGSGSGFGDLWSWTRFISLSKDDLQEAWDKELIRYETKYPTTRKIREDKINNLLNN
jgi:hypothetical protein